MRESVHPTRERLIAFIDDRLDETESGPVRFHVNECDFCTEFCADYRLMMDSDRLDENDSRPIDSKVLADRLYRVAVAGITIALAPLREDLREQGLPLAADNRKKPDPSDQHAITLYSEDPEIILRLVRGPEPDNNYVQLIADDSAMVSHVLVQAPQLGREFVTDADGRADLGAESEMFSDEIKWQIKMPDAIFDLEPLIYDPNKPEHSEQVILETDRHDKLEVTFERLTEGRKITLRLLELNGKPDFGEVKLIIATAQTSYQKQIGADSSATFEIDDTEATVNIRLFTK